MKKIMFGYILALVGVFTLTSAEAASCPGITKGSHPDGHSYAAFNCFTDTQKLGQRYGGDTREQNFVRSKNSVDNQWGDNTTAYKGETVTVMFYVHNNGDRGLYPATNTRLDFDWSNPANINAAISANGVSTVHDSTRVNLSAGASLKAINVKSVHTANNEFHDLRNYSQTNGFFRWNSLNSCFEYVQYYELTFEVQGGPNRPNPTCTNADFNPDTIGAGGSSTFSWTTQDTTGGVNLVCSGGGVNVNQSVASTGNQSITVPASNTGQPVTCQIQYNNANLCQDQLNVTPAPVLNPNIKIEKFDNEDPANRDDKQTVFTGGEAKFFIRVTNTGNEALRNVVITDSESTSCARTAAQTRSLHAGDATADFDPGEVFTYTCAKTNVQNGDFDTDTTQTTNSTDGTETARNGWNDAQVEGTGVTSGTKVEDQDPSEVVITAPGAAKLSIDKRDWNDDDLDSNKKDGSASDDDTQTVNSVDPKDIARFRITVENTGTTDLKEAQVTDGEASECALTPAQFAEILQTGSSSKATITQVMGLTSNNDNIFNVGEKFSYVCEQDGVRDGYTNVAVLSAKSNDPNVSDPADVNDDTEVKICNTNGGGITCPPVNTNPNIKIEKFDNEDPANRDDTQTVFTGGEAKFFIRVTNTGGEALKDVIITDSESTSCARTGNQTRGLYPGNTFDPGEVFTYTCAKTNVQNGDFDTDTRQTTNPTDGSETARNGWNDAQVEGTGVTSGTKVEDQDPSEVVITAPGAAKLSIDKRDWNDDDLDSNKKDGSASDDDTQTVNSVDPKDIARFRITVENTGTTDLKEAQVTDARASECALTVAEFEEILRTGSSSKATITQVMGLTSNNDNIFNVGEKFSYVCEQDGVRDGYTNVAVLSAKSNDPNVSDPADVNDDTEVKICNTNGGGITCPPVNTNPNIKIEKFDNEDPANRDDTQTVFTGGEAKFFIRVTNTGGEALKDVIITDSESTSCARTGNQTRGLYPGNTFDPGEVFTYTCAKTNVQNGDFDTDTRQTTNPTDGSETARNGWNDAQVEGTGVTSGTKVEDQDPSEVNVSGNPTGNLTVTKVASTMGDVPPGGIVTYTIRLENTGGAPFNDIVVVDDLDTTRVQFNNAIDSGITHAGGRVTINVPTLAANSTADYRFVVQVLGSAPLNTNLCNKASVISVNGATLPTPIVSPEICNPVKEIPASIKVDKTDKNPADTDGTQLNDTQTVASGADAVFQITVTNDGGVGLKPVVVTDPRAAQCAKSAGQTSALIQAIGNGDDTFDPGESFVYTCTKPNTISPYRNVVNVAGVPVNGTPTVTDSNPTVVLLTGVTPNPSISVDKDDADNTDDEQLVTAAGTAKFTITVLNDGNVTLENVQLTDAEANACNLTDMEVADVLSGATAIGASPATSPEVKITANTGNGDRLLDPNETFAYTCEVSNVGASTFDDTDGDGRGDNRIDVEGDPVTDTATVRDNDDTAVVLAGSCSGDGIEITKTAPNGGRVRDIDGDGTAAEVEYTIVVENTGTSKGLRDIEISDIIAPQCVRNSTTSPTTASLIQAVGNRNNVLDPGESFTYTCVQENVTSNGINTIGVEADIIGCGGTIRDTDTEPYTVSGCNPAVQNCGGGPGGGTPPTTPVLNYCSTSGVASGAFQCNGFKVAIKTGDAWNVYRTCVNDNPNGYSITPAGNVARECTRDYLELYKGFSASDSCNTNADCQSRKLTCKDLGTCPVGPIQCREVTDPSCPGCFKGNTKISKAVQKSTDPAGSYRAEASIADDGKAYYQITLDLEVQNPATYRIQAPLALKVYDKSIPSESGNIWNRDGIAAAPWSAHWDWNPVSGVCTDCFYMADLATEMPAKFNELKNTGRTTITIDYAMNAALAGVEDSTQVKNVAFAYAEYKYVNQSGGTMPVGGWPVEDAYVGIGANNIPVCTPVTIDQYTRGITSLGATATVHIVRPFAEAIGGNAGLQSKGTKSIGSTRTTKGALITNNSAIHLDIPAARKVETSDAQFDAIKDEYRANLEQYQQNLVDTANTSTDASTVINDLNATIAGLGITNPNNVKKVEAGSKPVFIISEDVRLSGDTQLLKTATFIIEGNLFIENNVADKSFTIPADKFAAFIVKGDFDQNLIIDNAVTEFDGLYYVEGVEGGIMASPAAIAHKQLRINGNLYGNLTHLLQYRKFVGNDYTQPEPALIVNYDSRLLSNTPPALEGFLGQDWREDIVD